MNATSQTILDAALQLSESDRMEIAQRLFDSLPEEDEIFGFDDPGFRVEMERREIEALESIPWKSGDFEDSQVDDLNFIAELERRFNDDEKSFTLEEFRALWK